MTLTLTVGVRAAGVRHRPHRAPVHRVRADARRRGAGVGLHRADADADDVLAAAASTRPSTRGSTTRSRAGSRRFTDGYRRAAHLRCCTHRWIVVGRRGSPRSRVGAVLFMPLKSRARADRGSRRRVRPRDRAAGLDAAVHGGPAEADRGVLRARAGGGRVHGDLRLPDGRRRQRGPAPEAVGGAHAQAAADRRRAAAEVRGDSRRARVPDQPAVARAERSARRRSST